MTRESSTRAVIFDAGGTLVYPTRPVGETYARFARRYGVELPPVETMAAFRRAMKKGSPRPEGGVPRNGDDRIWWREVVRQSVALDLFSDAAAFETFFEEVYVYYARPEAWTVYPEVPEVLHTLRARGYQLAVLSNWDSRLNEVLDGHGLGSFFAHRFISAELGWEKPDPAIYRHVSGVLGLKPAELLSLGDDKMNDCDTPQREGWQAIHIDRPRVDLKSATQNLPGI